MKRTNFLKVVAVATFLFISGQAHAQQWLKKLTQKATDAVTTTATVSNAVKIDWGKIPEYSLQRVNTVDAEGNQVMNDDGTPDYQVFLIDQFGNRRSAATVKEQQKKINQAIGVILAKVAIGAGLGGIQDGAEGAAIGAAAGAIASADDIKMATEQKKSLKQQKKLLETYQKNFTEEGKPVNANVDTSTLDGFDISEENTLSMTANDIKAEIENESFTKDDSAWEI